MVKIGGSWAKTWGYGAKIGGSGANSLSFRDKIGGFRVRIWGSDAKVLVLRGQHQGIYE